MGLLDKLFGRKKSSSNLDLAKALLNDQLTICEEGCDTDEIPGGHGEFGLCVTNPVPVKSIIANAIYLGKLRAANNEKITWDRIGSMSADNSSNPIDEYNIFDSDEVQIATIYISPYHKRISQKAPKGFKLIEDKDTV